MALYRSGISNIWSEKSHCILFPGLSYNIHTINHFLTRATYILYVCGLDTTSHLPEFKDRWTYIGALTSTTRLSMKGVPQ